VDGAFSQTQLQDAGLHLNFAHLADREPASAVRTRSLFVAVNQGQQFDEMQRQQKNPDGTQQWDDSDVED
jgi:hypothetical protein